MAHVRVWVGFFELAPRFDALIGNDNDVGFIVHMLKDRTQHFVEGDILVWKSLRAHSFDFRIVARVVGRTRA